jgi:hypothetical protein
MVIFTRGHSIVATRTLEYCLLVILLLVTPLLLRRGRLAVLRLLPV